MNHSTQIGVPPLPCLNSDISTEIHIEPHKKPLGLSVQQRRTAFVLQESVAYLASKYGIQFLGFLTLTFADHVTCPREAQRRLNSLITHVIKPRYREYVGVMERQKSGRIHYHLLIVLPVDIRTGVDFSALARRSYKSAGTHLRNEWAFWRRTHKKYRFGRCELLPVRTTAEAMAKYVGKYIAKSIDCRHPEDKGARLVRMSRGARAGTTKFQFHSPGSQEWRRKLGIFAEIVRSRTGEPIEGIPDLTRVLGPRWAYINWDFIMALP